MCRAVCYFCSSRGLTAGSGEAGRCGRSERRGEPCQALAKCFAHLGENVAADGLQPFLGGIGQFVDEAFRLLVEPGHGGQQPGV